MCLLPGKGRDGVGRPVIFLQVACSGTIFLTAVAASGMGSGAEAGVPVARQGERWCFATGRVKIM